MLTLTFQTIPSRTILASVLVILVIAVSANAFQQGAPEIIKVEPPSWWAGHTINPVRLLVRGKNLANARIRPMTRSVQTSGTRIRGNGNYLFVDVRVNANARPGLHPLVVETNGGRVTIPFRIEAALPPVSRFQGITSDDVIYLIMPDRFANGDSSNDKPADSPPEANDRKNARAYHGGDLRGIINRLPYLKGLGVTALWLTPWYDNWNGVNKCDKPWCPNTYYHGYHAIDYYAVEDRFGDMATLRELVDKAHASGIKVIQDQVANHVGSRHPWVLDPPLDDLVSWNASKAFLEQVSEQHSPYTPRQSRRIQKHT